MFVWEKFILFIFIYLFSSIGMRAFLPQYMDSLVEAQGLSGCGAWA